MLLNPNRKFIVPLFPFSAAYNRKWFDSSISHFIKSVFPILRFQNGTTDERQYKHTNGIVSSYTVKKKQNMRKRDKALKYWVSLYKNLTLMTVYGWGRF